jgi:hypothetical protein
MAHAYDARLSHLRRSLDEIGPTTEHLVAPRQSGVAVIRSG